MECPQCGRSTDSDASFCTECGQSLGNADAEDNDPRQDTVRPTGRSTETLKLSCPRCGCQNTLETTHCSQCGAVLRADLRSVDTYRPEAAPAASGDAHLVPESRVLVFTVLSFGLYLLYWMYLTWKQYRDSVTQPHSQNQETATTQYPVWHALTLLVPIYGLYRAHAHMAAFRDLMRSQGLRSTISPGWCVAAVLPFTFRAIGGALTALSVGVGPEPQLRTDAAVEVQQSADAAATGTVVEALTRSELVLGLAIEVVVLAALTWMLVHVQGNINAYWSKVRGAAGTVSVSLVEIALGMLGAVMWAITLITVLGAS